MSSVGERNPLQMFYGNLPDFDNKANVNFSNIRSRVSVMSNQWSVSYGHASERHVTFGRGTPHIA